MRKIIHAQSILKQVNQREREKKKFVERDSSCIKIENKHCTWCCIQDEYEKCVSIFVIATNKFESRTYLCL